MPSIRIAGALAALALLPAAAQAQSTITACYVPKTGSVYRTQAPGAPDACKNGHVEFSWESGASPELMLSHTTYTQLVSVPAGETVDYTKACPAGEQLVTGGYVKSGAGAADLEVQGSYPSAGTEGWRVLLHNHGAAEADLVVLARCFTIIEKP